MKTNISQAVCHKCGGQEPQSYDAQKHGIWICRCARNKRESLDRVLRLRGVKTLDQFKERLKKKVAQ